MKIIESMVRRIEIREIKGLDPIRVMLEDTAPGQGRITIECFGTAWSNYWPGMGKDTISEFFCGCDEHYIAKKLSSVAADIFDPDALIDTLKREVLSDRRNNYLSKKEARDRFAQIDDIDLPDSIEQLHYTHSDLMHELLGDEWWYRLPKKPNPDYEYLTRIIKTVQSALLEIQARTSA